MKHSRLVVVALLATSLTMQACKDNPPVDDQQQHIAEVVASGGVVDSIHPIGEALDRFRIGIDRVDTLSQASSSVQALTERWTQAVVARDTADLNAMLLNRAEFAWLYYPDSKMSKPPYDAPPQLLWGQVLASSNEGAQAVLRRFGGEKLTMTSVRCPQPAVIESGNLLHERCLLTLMDAGDVVPETSYFGTIIERGKRFKFVGYANRQ